MRIENNSDALRAMTLAFKLANKSVTKSYERGKQYRSTAKRIFKAVEQWDATQRPQP